MNFPFTEKNTKSNSLKQGLLFLTASLIAVVCIGQNNIGQLDDRCKTKNYRAIDGWGEYPVQAGQSTDSHDPRIERKGLTKIKPGDKRTFEATYKIVNANNTTFAQILNQDQRTSDKHKPVVFIIADPSGDKWRIRDQQKELIKISKNEEFTLRIDTYYNGSKTKCYSDVYINGVKKETKTHARVGQDAQMRYGNYHHGNGTAVIRVKNVTWQTTAQYLANNGNGGNNIKPTVNFTTPANNLVLQQGYTPFAVNVDAKDDDGNIASVMLKLDGSDIRTEVNGPYDWNHNNQPEDKVLDNLTIGEHTLTAIATDDQGAKTEKSIKITVEEPKDCHGTSGGSASIDDCGVCSGGATGIIVDACNKCETVFASVDDGNIPDNVLDDDLDTRWSANGVGEYIEFCLEEEKVIESVSIAFFKGDERTTTFDIEYSLDGITYTNILTDMESSGNSVALEKFDFAPVNVKKLRLVGKGNSSNTWNSISEIEWAEPSVTNVTSLDLEMEFGIYPNPSSSGVFYLPKDVEWKVYTVQGVFIEMGEGQKVDISENPKGVYILKAENEGVVIRKS